MSMFIFSVDLKTDSEEVKADKRNDIRMFLETILGPVGGQWDEALGCYNGQVEVSFVVYSHDLTMISGSIFSAYGQESVLLVDDALDATLVFANGDRLSLGKWQQSDKGNLVAYTFLNNNYYVCA